MLETHFRQAANVLLEAAIRLAPPDVREWGQAIRGELDYVDGAWASLEWAFGGATVLAKQALIAILMPGRRGQVVPPGNELFAKSVSLRKVALAAGSVYVLGALIFLAAPPFRQGLRVSMAAWEQLFYPSAWNNQPGLRTLAWRAEARQDAEGLAFVAARLLDGRESARLADEAVHLDSDFLWVYGVVAVRHPGLAEIRGWLPQLRRWDAQNALPYLISAESIDIDLVGKNSGLPPQKRPKAEDDPDWRSDMAGAFASAKFDDYLDRLKELDGSVVRRYGFDDPYALLSTESWFARGLTRDLPTYAFADSEQFAKVLLESGQQFEARGQPRGAAEQYWTVARFGQALDTHAQTESEELGLHLQALAYSRLERLAANEGNSSEAATFGYLATKFEPTRAERHESQDEAVFHRQILWRNAFVLQVSGLLSIIFTGLLTIAVLVLIATARGGAEPRARRARSAATLITSISAAALLLSSATIYLTYRPYFYMFQRAILKGDESQSSDLRVFLGLTQLLPGADAAEFRIRFWWTVILLGILGLILILLRHVRGHTRAQGLQQRPRVT